MPKVDPETGKMMTDDPDTTEDQAGGHADPAKDDGKDPHEQMGGGQSGG